MTLEFDIEDFTSTEFGIGRDDGDDFVTVFVDGDVKSALREMVRTTQCAMKENAEQPSVYDPSEKHSGTEHLYVDLDDPLVDMLRMLHNAENLPSDTNALHDPSTVFCYFARLIDNQGRRLTALRRATYFKGVLKSRLIRLVSDALRLVEDKVFKLDQDFDVLIYSDHLHIWRPSAFEFLGRLKQAILDEVPTNVAVIQQAIPGVDFEDIGRYASTHPRAARYLASIRTQNLTGIDPSRLRTFLTSTGIEIMERMDGSITVPDIHVMGFLEVLDRRRYRIDLVPGDSELFRATSRQRLGG